MPPSTDQLYRTLGVSPGASDDELRAAYRRLVKRHHPDHNGGSLESAQMFEAVQDAYAELVKLRSGGGARGGGATGARGASGSSTRGGSGSSARGGSGSSAGGSAAAGADPHIETKIADMERELRAAQAARERAQEAARRAVAEASREAADTRSRAAAGGERPSDEDLGYFSTDDSLSKIIADARSELSNLFSEARDSPPAQRLGELIDELTSKLSGDK
jgi:curved DNA-binding protein CbpA